MTDADLRADLTALRSELMQALAAVQQTSVPVDKVIANFSAAAQSVLDASAAVRRVAGNGCVFEDEADAFERRCNNLIRPR